MIYSDGMSILRAGFGVGLSVALAAGCSAETESTRVPDRARIQGMIDSLETVPGQPYAPPSHVGTYKNANGENIELTVRDGEPYIERRNFSRYAGLLVDCHVRLFFSSINGEEVFNRTLIAVRVGKNAMLETAAPDVTKVTTYESVSSETIFCQPSFVSDVFPPSDGQMPLEKGDIEQYCMEVPQDTNRAVAVSTNLSACRVSY